MFEDGNDKYESRDRIARAWNHGLIVLAFLGIALAAILWGTDDTDLSLGRDGIKITVKRNDTFIDVFQRALDPEKSDQTTSATMRALLRESGFVDARSAIGNNQDLAVLAENGFYSLDNSDFVRVLSEKEFSGEDSVRDELLEMLWDRKGPFEDGTLLGAQAKFIPALEEVYGTILSESAPVPLVEQLWVRGIEWKSPFERRNFSAEVYVLPDEALESDEILVCQGSEHLTGKFLRVSIPDPLEPGFLARGTGSIEERADVSEAIFPCSNGTSVSQMLGGDPLRLAIPERLARRILMPDDRDGVLGRSFQAQFLVRPLHLVSTTKIDAN